MRSGEGRPGRDVREGCSTRKLENRSWVYSTWTGALCRTSTRTFPSYRPPDTSPCPSHRSRDQGWTSSKLLPGPRGSLDGTVTSVVTGVVTGVERSRVLVRRGSGLSLGQQRVPYFLTQDKRNHTTPGQEKKRTRSQAHESSLLRFLVPFLGPTPRGVESAPKSISTSSPDRGQRSSRV